MMWVLVTGGSRGIGRAIAFGLAAAGARVIGTATSESGAAELSATLAAHGLQGRGAVLDVSSDASIDALLADLEATHSMPSILVNNAAITRDGLLLRMKADDWNQVIATNLTAVYRLSKGVLRRMMKERRGRIINITSIVGVTGNPGQVNYSAAKAGVLGFTKSLAQEVALPRHHCQRRGTGIHRHRHDQGPVGGPTGGPCRAHPHGAAGCGRRCCIGGTVSGLTTGGIHHR